MPTIYVSTNADCGRGSLRAAFEKANLIEKSTRIVILPCVEEDIELKSGPIEVKSDVKLISESKCALTIFTVAEQSLFVVSDRSKYFKISRLELEGGSTPQNGGAINVTVANHRLVLNAVRIVDNHSANLGGGIYTLGSLEAIDSVLKCNKAGKQGGAIWAGKDVTLINTRVYENKVLEIASSSGGAGLYVDDGNCILDYSLVSHNEVMSAMGAGGSAGGILVMAGNLYIQNESQVNSNKAFSSAGVQVVIGNIFVTNKSTVNCNESFNSADAAGGGALSSTLGSTYVSDSELCDNKTVGMFGSAIISLIGDGFILNKSKINGNSNRGPGTLAFNIGSVTVDGECEIMNNESAGLGAAIVNFCPLPGFVSVSGKTKICGNTLTNARTIRQVVAAFIDIIINHLDAQSAQASLGGGSGGQKYVALLPNLKERLRNAHSLLPIMDDNKIGGTIASLTTASVMIKDSYIENNFVGKDVEAKNSPFTAEGGAVYGFLAPITVKDSYIRNNTSLSNGAGIWSGAFLNVSNSDISGNEIKKEGSGGGIYSSPLSNVTLIDSTIKKNIAKQLGGGVFAFNPLVKYETQIKDNTPDNVAYPLL